MGSLRLPCPLPLIGIYLASIAQIVRPCDVGNHGPRGMVLIKTLMHVSVFAASHVACCNNNFYFLPNQLEDTNIY